MAQTLYHTILFRSPSSRKKNRDQVDSEREGVAKKSEEEESGPEDEETLLMKQMMGFSKFDTTKVWQVFVVRRSGWGIGRIKIDNCHCNRGWWSL